MTEQRDHVMPVRHGFEEDLVAELGASRIRARVVTPGLVLASGNLPPSPFVFERQRLPGAEFIEEASLKPVTEETLSRITAKLRASDALWATHVFETQTELADRAEGFARNLTKLIERQMPTVAERHVFRAKDSDALVLQLCRTPEGLWFSTAPLADLSCPWPGGIPRMKDDPRAPSRSYLKVEEAFARMGEAPIPGQTAVDLGAAPGGWSLALIKRGCDVTAVDNGPLRLPEPEAGWGRLDYINANGITFEPHASVDWLVADMLVPPGVALGLLRRWMQRRLMRRLVVNVKIPQDRAFDALKPVLDFLHSMRGTYSTFTRQLFHDRREVTVMGRLVED